MRSQFLGLVLAILGLLAATPGVPSPQPSAVASPEASPDPNATPFINPLCSVGFLTTAWDTNTNALAKVNTARLTARLFLDGSNPGAHTLGAHLIILSDSQVFEADVPELPLDTTKERRTSQFFIALPSAFKVASVYVDSFSVDGGTSVDCPTQISGNGTTDYVHDEFPSPAKPMSVPVVVARYRQDVPPLPCGKIRIDAKVKKAALPAYPYGLSKPATSKIAVFIDSRGTIVRADVFKSSGSTDADVSAQAAAYASVYVPALFMCQPVVGEYLFTAVFMP